MNLFDLGKKPYRIYDEKRRRYLPIGPFLLDEQQAEMSNAHYRESLCPHFKVVPDTAKTYTIKRDDGRSFSNGS